MFRVVLCSLLLVLMQACSDAAQHSAMHHKPAGYGSGDECHICGMVITRFGGPKGQALDKRTTDTRKFCSTIELMIWYLQPENQPNVEVMYVHDMSKSSWESPDDSHLIKASEASYVVGSNQRGSMGKTLASFSKADDAQQFANQYGGHVLAFSELTLNAIAGH